MENSMRIIQVIALAAAVFGLATTPAAAFAPGPGALAATYDASAAGNTCKRCSRSTNVAGHLRGVERTVTFQRWSLAVSSQCFTSAWNWSTLMPVSVAARILKRASIESFAIAPRA